MSKVKNKLVALLVALCCVFTCLSVGALVISNNAIGASAATTYTINRLDGLGSSDQSHIEAYVPTDEYKDNEGNAIYGSQPSVNSWSYKFTFVEGTGAGFRYNGEIINDYGIKQPGTDFYIELGGRTAVAGDIVTIDGTFNNAEADVDLVFVGCGLQFDGTKWLPYNHRNMDALQLHVNSTTGAASGLNSDLYLKRAYGKTLPVQSWDHAFVATRAENFKVNGNGVEGMVMKSTNGGMYFGFGGVEAGTVITISGDFYCEALDETYTIAESSFKWTGEGWVGYREIGNLVLHGNSTVGGAKGDNSVLYLTRQDGKAFPFLTWSDDYVFVGQGADTFKVNDNGVDAVAMKSTGDGMYFAFGAVDPGAVVTISGEYYCANQYEKYIISESSFRWTGSGWENVTKYQTISVGTVKPNADSTGTGLYLVRTDGDKFEINEGGSWNCAFSLKDGTGITLAGVQQVGDNNIKVPGESYMYVLIAEPKTDDILVISGTLYNETLQVEYVINKSQFKWNGSKWETYYDVYEIGEVVIGNGSSISAVYFDKANGEKFEVTDGKWNEKLTYESGTGVTLGGTQIDMGDIKIPNNIYVALGRDAQKGEELVIGGTFYNENLCVKYVIKDSKFTWNGSGWERAAVELGKAIAISGSATGVYLEFADGIKLPVDSWDYPFNELDGVGSITVDGNSFDLTNNVKSVGNKLYVEIREVTVDKDSVFKISGTFRNTNTGYKYVITESTFIWTGTYWEPPIEYDPYDIGELTLHVNSSTGAASGINDQLYLQKVNGGLDGLPVLEWNILFFADDENNFKINGEKATLLEVQSTTAGIYFKFNAVNAGDVVTVKGTFKCATKGVKYTISSSSFKWTGTGWTKTYTEEELETYDVVTMKDLGIGVGETITSSSNLESWPGLSYYKSEKNTTGSIVFRFGYQSSNVEYKVVDGKETQDSVDFRLRGGNWEGVRFHIDWGGIYLWDERIVDGNPVNDAVEGTTKIPLENGKSYVIELGAIDFKETDEIWVYVKIDGEFKINVRLNKETYGYTAYNTNHVSISVARATEINFTDPDYVAVTYQNKDGSFVEYAKKGEIYHLSQAKSFKTFIGWVMNGEVYSENATVVLTESVTVEALEVDFKLKDGASIRLTDKLANAGIRFTLLLSESDLAKLSSYGVSVEYGVLITPYDWLEAGQVPNLEEFTVGSTIIKLTANRENEVAVDGTVSFNGSMVNVKEGNYERLFAGRGYITLTVDGNTWNAYTPFSSENNVRSIRQVAQKYQVDATADNKYEDQSDEIKAVVDAYAKTGEINLMNYDAYKENVGLNATAWYYPELDDSNGYMNQTNYAIADKMADAGIKVVYLDGENHLNLDTLENVERTRQIIEMFWSRGIKTIAFGSNNSSSCNIDYSQVSFPDYSDCEGFMGYLMWDEPSTLEDLQKIASFAQNFNATYAGTDVIFMANLLASYAEQFTEDSNYTNWFESGVDLVDTEKYTQYLQNYIDTVLSQVKGEKWLSLDTYPIKADKTLSSHFLYDLAMLKIYSLKAGATSHAVLQSSGWIEDGSETMYRMPTEAEMRMQAYTAMAFGIDSISWWSYANKREDQQYNPTDSDDYYTRFANVNNELDAIDHIYKAFNNWKGVILNIATKSTAPDKDAYNAVKNNIGVYYLAATDTKHLSSIATANQRNYSLLTGVMEDANGNEAYVLCNYANHSDDRSQTVTINFSTNVTEIVIYRGGVKSTQTVSSKTLTVDLATGEGVIIIPSKLG